MVGGPNKVFRRLLVCRRLRMNFGGEQTGILRAHQAPGGTSSHEVYVQKIPYLMAPRRGFGPLTRARVHHRGGSLVVTWDLILA